MYVYLLIEETDQNEFNNRFHITAEPRSTVIGVYSTREAAEKEKERMDFQAKENAREYDADPQCYIIEERPIL